MNFSRSSVNLTQLKNNNNFNNFVVLLQRELESARDLYESTSPASDFLRGRVSVLKEIVSELTNTHIR